MKNKANDYLYVRDGQTNALYRGRLRSIQMYWLTGGFTMAKFAITKQLKKRKSLSDVNGARACVGNANLVCTPR